MTLPGLDDGDSLTLGTGIIDLLGGRCGVLIELCAETEKVGEKARLGLDHPASDLEEEGIRREGAGI
jgi:hypothetical protein